MRYSPARSKVMAALGVSTSKGLAVRETEDLERRRSDAERELLHVLGQVERGQVGARIESHVVAAGDLQLEPSAIARVHAVAGPHRDVQVEILPFVGIIAAV
jgi:hypothetical protein